MSERRYTDEEVSAIFAAATEEQSPSRAPSANTGAGLTLSDLQDIGRQAGIPADAVARAARALDVRGQASAQTVFGLPLGVGHTVALPGKLTDQQWEQLVVQLRETFHATGSVRSFGSMREWRNGNLQVLLEPTDTGQRLRMQTMNSAGRAYLGMGAMLVGMSGALALATTLAGELGHALPGIAFLGVIGAGMAALGALRLPGWARVRARQMELIAEKASTGAAGPQ